MMAQSEIVIALILPSIDDPFTSHLLLVATLFIAINDYPVSELTNSLIKRNCIVIHDRVCKFVKVVLSPMVLNVLLYKSGLSIVLVP